VKVELESALAMLSGKAKGQKGKALRGAERRKMWEEVRALRKEYVVSISPSIYEYAPYLSTTRYRLREGGVVKKVLAETQVCLFRVPTSCLEFESRFTRPILR
jgi:DNA polymerase alpha-associated DNA helicase A